MAQSRRRLLGRAGGFPFGVGTTRKTVEQRQVACEDASVPFDFQASYDDLNPDDEDYRFYAGLAVERNVRTAVDLGCGTGTLARLLAAQGIDVLAVDPDSEMLRVARAGDLAEAATGSIEWRLGDSSDLDADVADFAVMSGHVAQVFTDDESWLRTLQDLHRALKAGGILAFESRNPGARRWEEWTRARTLRTVQTPEGPVEFWHETVNADLPLVSYDTCTRNLRTHEEQVDRDVLSFRDEARLRASLHRSGFEVTAVFGTWDGQPSSESRPELIVQARKP